MNRTARHAAGCARRALGWTHPPVDDRDRAARRCFGQRWSDDPSRRDDPKRSGDPSWQDDPKQRDDPSWQGDPTRSDGLSELGGPKQRDARMRPAYLWPPYARQSWPDQSTKGDRN